MGQINNFYFCYFLLLRGYHRLALLQIMQLNLSISDINDISKHLTVNIYAFGNQFFNSSNRKKAYFTTYIKTYNSAQYEGMCKFFDELVRNTVKAKSQLP